MKAMPFLLLGLFAFVSFSSGYPIVGAFFAVATVAAISTYRKERRNAAKQ